MTVVLVAIIVLVAMLLLGVPIPFAFLVSTLILVLTSDIDPSSLLRYGYTKAGSIILCAIPIFILAGSLMEKSGIGESLVNFVSMFIGRIKGGLGIVMTVSCALFGAISGSGMATLSCIGSIMLPRMEAAGYPRHLSAALIANSSLLGLLIPPSLTMILYAFTSGQSVLACFLSTLIPGIILVVLLSVVNIFMYRKLDGIIVEDKLPSREFARAFGKRTTSAIPALIAPFIILGGIYGGLMTPTEAAAVAVVYTVPVGWFIYKGLRLKTLKESLVYSGTTAGVIMAMLFSIMMLSNLYVRDNVPSMILGAMTSVTENPAILLVIVNCFLIVIGMIMDDTSAILLATPLLLPIVTNPAIGIDPVHFAAIVGVNLGMGCVTPPCAPFLYLASRVGSAPVSAMLKPTMLFIAFAWIPTLIITTYIPSVALFLPKAFGLA